MLQVISLSKSYGPQRLFDSVSFTLGAGERLGVVGRNGHGKTTLFRIVTGEEEADAGEVLIPSGYRLGYLTQKLSFSAPSVLKEAELALAAQEGGWKETHKAEQILFGLGFGSADLAAAPAELSGGFQVRLHLAKVLLDEPNLLLLDEPTNYLDIVSLRWLERFLCSWRGELMLITHDRSFMDQVVTHTLGIHRAKVKKIAGATSSYYSRVREDEETHERTRLNLEKKREEQMVFIERFRAKNTKATAVQSRIKALGRMEKLEELRDISNLAFRFPEDPFPGPYVLRSNGITFGYTANELLIRDLSFTVRRADRIAVVGKNGKGKTTLLSLLAQELKPSAGAVHHPDNLRFSYFGQTNVDRLCPDYTVEQELLAVQPEQNRTAARGIAGAMMFEGDQALKQIKILSGGERSRVLLGKVLSAPSNLLLLDEPTNHLDMESSEALLKALKSYSGAVVIVTHNEMFLRALATRLIVFDRGGVSFFDGTYDDFIERVGWCDEEEERRAEVNSEGGSSRKDLRRRRAEIIKSRSEDVRPLETEVAALEDRIVELEAQIETAAEQLAKAAEQGLGSEVAELSRTLRADQEEIEELFETLDGRSKILSDRLAYYERQLKELE